MDIRYPYQVDARGRTATAASNEDHLRDLIEQLLFTAPGERVNRPTFGSGLLQLVFTPNNQALVAALQMTVQSALQQWLGDLIEVQNLDIASQDATLSVAVQYRNRRTGQQQIAQFARSV
ncbi:MAG: GPW/gp25 family protein [Bryobacteraceae bacterium]|jgi:phage baseplate assembly protein W